MVQNAAEGKEDVRSVNTELGCSHTELLIVGDSNKMVYFTSRITAPWFLTDKTRALIQVHPEFLETSLMH